MKILKGPNDNETLAVFKNMTAEEIFQSIKKYEVDEKWFHYAVLKGLFEGKSSEKILLISSEGGALSYVENAYYDVKREHTCNLNQLLDDSLCLAAKFGHLKVVQFLFKKGANINYAYLNSGDHSHILEFAIENGAKISNRLIDKSGKEHSILFYLLQNINKSLAEYLDSKSNYSCFN